VIGADNKTFYVTEFFSCYDAEAVNSEDEIVQTYLQDGESALEYV